MKRKRALDTEEWVVSKKLRQDTTDALSNLSDELLLKILAHLPIQDLATAQRVSRRFQRLAGDSEVWKQKYYARWVRPRALRIPGVRDAADASSGALQYSSKLAKWLDHSHLIQQGRKTDWKRQYRLRYNWWCGSCRIRELEVAQPPVPPVMVKICHGFIFTVDAKNGLRAWASKPQLQLVAAQLLPPSSTAVPSPTALGLDASAGAQADVRLSVGLQDGSFHLYNFSTATQEIRLRYSHPSSSNGAVSATALAIPYLLTMSQSKTLSLYQFDATNISNTNATLQGPHLLASLKSDMAYTPLSLSIRASSVGIVACIAYAFSRLNQGWSVGLQELRLSPNGDHVGSRLASTGDAEMNGFHSLKNKHTSVAARSTVSAPFALHPQAMARPTSLSYSHPYLLASLPDNTLMVYLVVSNVEKLAVSAGRRLWGHTSAVSGAAVSDRGKAVSVSTMGSEIRVWELEEVMSSASHRRSSIRISPERDANIAVVTEAFGKRGNGLGLALRDIQMELATTKSWVGFDDEQVVVLGEHCRRQILSCYDFT